MAKDKVDQKADEVADQDLVVPEPPVTSWLSTGCTLLDLAIANQLPGGFPIGRIVEIFGPPSSCKSVFGMVAMGFCQRLGGIGFYADVECTLDSNWASLYGLDCSDTDGFRLTTGENAPSTVEELFDEYLDGIMTLEDRRRKIVVVDTLSALSSVLEDKTGLADSASYAPKAKKMSAGFRKYSPPRLAKKNVSIIFLNQTRENVGVVFGPKEVTTGGKAVSFYSSVRIRLMTGLKIENSSGVKIGVWVRFEVEKNKIAPPFREGMFRIIFDYGLDDIFSNLVFLQKYQKHEKGSKKVDFDGQSRVLKSMAKYVEDSGKEERLRQEVEKMWRKIYAPSDRKPRTWK
jgi:recombination protein RecA